MINTFTVSASTITGFANTSTVTANMNNTLPFNVSTPTTVHSAGTISIKGTDKETAEFDAAFINDLKLLLEVINDLPDEHPLGELKHDMRMRRAFKRLGG